MTFAPPLSLPMRRGIAIIARVGRGVTAKRRRGASSTRRRDVLRRLLVVEVTLLVVTVIVLMVGVEEPLEGAMVTSMQTAQIIHHASPSPTGNVPRVPTYVDGTPRTTAALPMPTAATPTTKLTTPPTVLVSTGESVTHTAMIACGRRRRDVCRRFLTTATITTRAATVTTHPAPTTLRRVRRRAL